MDCDGKRAAALGAIELIGKLGLGGSTRVGIGTGSTVASFLVEMHRLRPFTDYAVYYPSSREALLSLASDGLLVGHPGSVEEIDVYIDGADEVDGKGRLVKGRGAALLGEKILAFKSKINIIIVDESKIVSRLGEKKPLPIEVVPDALPAVLRTLENRGLNPKIRRGSGKDGPVISDWGGIIVDLRTGPIEDPESLEAELKLVPGIIETGLFISLTDYVVVGRSDCTYRVLRFERYRRA